MAQSKKKSLHHKLKQLKNKSSLTKNCFYFILNLLKGILVNFYENNKLAIIFFLILAIVGGFFGYDYFQKKEEAKNAIFVVDRIAMNVRVDYPYDEDQYGNNVDLINTNTQEIYFHVSLSKSCPGFHDNRDSNTIDVIRIVKFNSKTNEKFDEFDGAYQKICWGKTIYNHGADTDKKTDSNTGVPLAN